MPSTETVSTSHDFSFDETIDERQNDRYSQKSVIGFVFDEIETEYMNEPPKFSYEVLEDS